MIKSVIQIEFNVYPDATPGPANHYGVQEITAKKNAGPNNQSRPPEWYPYHRHLASQLRQLRLRGPRLSLRGRRFAAPHG